MSGAWPCPKCTRLNGPEFVRCPVCKTKDPKKLRTAFDRQRHQARMRGFKSGNGR